MRPLDGPAAADACARRRSGRGRRRPPRRPAGGTGTRPPARSEADPSRSGQRGTRRPARGRRRRTRAAAARLPRWESRWLTSKPQRMARSIWARHSRRTSSRSAWSHRSSTGAGEAAVAVEQGRGVGDRAPAVEVVLGVEGEVHADVLAPVAGGRLAGPRARDHQAGAGGRCRRAGPRRRRRWRRGSSPRSSQLTISRRASGGWPRRSASDVTARDVPAPRRAPVHAQGRGRRPVHRPRPASRACGGGATSSSAWATLGGMVSGRAKPSADQGEVHEEAVGAGGRRRPGGGRSGRGPRRRRTRRTAVPAGSRALVRRDASWPKHCTGVPGFTVSGVSMPMRRTCSVRRRAHDDACRRRPPGRRWCRGRGGARRPAGAGRGGRQGGWRTGHGRRPAQDHGHRRRTGPAVRRRRAVTADGLAGARVGTNAPERWPWARSEAGAARGKRGRRPVAPR